MEGARLGDMLTLVKRHRLRELDVLLHVDVKLPTVDGMGLLDVDDEELDAVAVLAVELLQTPGLLAEGRSGVRTEGERDRPFAAKAGKLYGA